jgi:hypothetical protein
MKFQTTLFVALHTILVSCTSRGTSPGKVPAGVSIGAIVSTGTGCVGDASLIVSPGKSTVTFSTPSLKISTNDTVGTRSKMCQFSIPVTYPPRYQYSLQHFSFSGHQKSPSNSSTFISGFSQFAGHQESRNVGVEFAAGSGRDYKQVFTLLGLWSACGAWNSTQTTVNFQSKVTIGNSTKRGEVSINTGVLQLVWQAC